MLSCTTKQVLGSLSLATEHGTILILNTLLSTILFYTYFSYSRKFKNTDRNIQKLNDASFTKSDPVQYKYSKNTEITVYTGLFITRLNVI